MTTDTPTQADLLHQLRRREVQAIGAAISTRNWHDLERAYNALRDKMDAAGAWNARASHPIAAGDGEKLFEARHCPGIPTDCCDFGVISYATGKEVCRVWEHSDAELIACLLNTTPPQSDTLKKTATTFNPGDAVSRNAESGATPPQPPADLVERDSTEDAISAFMDKIVVDGNGGLEFLEDALLAACDALSRPTLPDREKMSIAVAKAVHPHLSNGENVYEVSNQVADAILALFEGEG